jgi:hypothetical protein
MPTCRYTLFGLSGRPHQHEHGLGALFEPGAGRGLGATTLGEFKSREGFCNGSSATQNFGGTYLPGQQNKPWGLSGTVMPFQFDELPN